MCGVECRSGRGHVLAITVFRLRRQGRGVHACRSSRERRATEGEQGRKRSESSAAARLLAAGSSSPSRPTSKSAPGLERIALVGRLANFVHPRPLLVRDALDFCRVYFWPYSAPVWVRCVRMLLRGQFARRLGQLRAAASSHSSSRHPLRPDSTHLHVCVRAGCVCVRGPGVVGLGAGSESVLSVAAAAAADLPSVVSAPHGLDQLIAIDEFNFDAFKSDPSGALNDTAISGGAWMRRRARVRLATVDDPTDT